MTRKAKLIAMMTAFLLSFAGVGYLFDFKPENLLYAVLIAFLPVIAILSFDYRMKLTEDDYEYDYRN
ncbi:hypothetical protein AWM70_21590 [Paenibacillus yonginensis]|uniref:Uncharacterized protein n=1 Tax=Paenibacillus yonginensis TaxID=1462996 RepID=A0A1B1N644_9BACL|nr:hypothetical protein [Paenibacillus yonginensis]ANS76855.1 hypothetical protein AWM70_21590 [Paenibacillus yonginensis]